MSLSAWVAVLGLISSSAVQGRRSGARAPDPRLWNTGLATRFLPSGPAAGVLGYVVPEADQGEDGNGDGDTLDQVLHLVDPRARTVRVVPRAWASTDFLSRAGFGDFLALAVSEAGQGIDLNGDGDLGDRTQAVVDARTGLVRDLGLATESFFGARNVLSVRSPFGGFDANGSLSVYVAEQERLIPLGRVGDGRITPDGLAVQFVSEPYSALDLNGDGDQSDTVVGLYDLARDELVNTGLAVRVSSGSDAAAVQRGVLLVPLSEQGQGLDLNGDGDLRDHILHEFDLTTRSILDRGLDGSSMVAARLHESDAEAAVYFIVHEDGRDLNGDGDTRDSFWYARTADGRIEPFPGELAEFSRFRVEHFGKRFVAGYLDGTTRVLDVLAGIAGDLKNPSFIDVPPRASTRLLAFTFAEELAGEDVDGDGQMEDLILHVHDFARGTSTTLGRAADVDFTLGFFPRLGLDGGCLAFASRELPGRDANGDGDTLDSTVWIYADDAARAGRPRWIDTHTSLRARRPGEFVYFPFVGGPWVVWSVLESEESRDLDPDGALDDELLAVYHVPSRSLSFFPGAQLNTAIDGQLALGLAEARHGDRNGDGDALDTVLHFVLPP